MKQLFTALIFVFATGAFASANEDLKIAQGQDHGDECFVKSFMAANPTDHQKTEAGKVHDAVKKVFEDNQDFMQDAAKVFMAVVMAHPICLEDAEKAAHRLGAAVHPVQDAMFTGMITVVNLLTLDQRSLFNTAMHDCNHE